VKKPRFEIVYELYSLEQNIHLRLKTKVSEDAWKRRLCRGVEGANWHEREIFDMMGIRFANHPTCGVFDVGRLSLFSVTQRFPVEGKPSDMPDVAFSDIAPLQGVRS